MTKLLEKIKNNTTKDQNSAIVSNLEVTEVVLVQCNNINNDYKHHSRVLHSLIPNKSYGQLLNISPKFLYL